MIVAVSVEELRQATATQYSSYNATCYDDVSQHDDASSQLESDSELSLPQQKVGPHHVVHWSQWVDCCVCGPKIISHHGKPCTALIMSYTVQIRLTQPSALCWISFSQNLFITLINYLIYSFIKSTQQTCMHGYDRAVEKSMYT